MSTLFCNKVFLGKGMRKKQQGRGSQQRMSKRDKGPRVRENLIFTCTCTFLYM